MTTAANSRFAVDDGSSVQGATVLGISASMKPATVSGRSAARALLLHTLETLATGYRHVALLDLARHPLPPFDGRFPSERQDRNLDLAVRCTDRCGGLVLSVPAYWAGVSGVFKNFIDAVCGPAYDLPPGAATPFAGKPTGVIVVGADEESAIGGAEQCGRVLASVGARLVADPVVLANPRGRQNDVVDTAGEAVALAARVAAEVVRSNPEARS